VAYLATGAGASDALAAGPVAALDGAPVLLAGANCVSNVVNAEIDRLTPARIVLLGGAGALGPGVEERNPCPFFGAADHGVSVNAAATPAFDDDGPDPDLVRFGSNWYGYTTGTRWGNRIGVLTTTDPGAGWHTSSGSAFGSTALPSAPTWEVPDSQWAPGVFFFGGHFVLFYAAQARATGKRCLSVASGDSPTGPFVDRTSGPIICQTDIGGSIDPQPFIDADGQPWLYWKNNDGSSPAVSKVWASPLGTDGMTPIAAAREVLAKNRERYPWQTTVDNPQMVLANGVYYLFHSGGDFQGNGSYVTGYAVCAGPLGPCTTAANPILSSYADVAGPGGGTVAGDGAGHWWISYHAWTSGCTSYSCGGKRRFYVAPLTFR
jgi:beta-xylosidase